jgi:hypothetical protein
MPTGPKGQKHSATSPKSRKLTPDEQAAQFKKTAREIGCDESPGALDRAFGKIAPKKQKTV